MSSVAARTLNFASAVLTLKKNPENVFLWKKNRRPNFQLDCFAGFQMFHYVMVSIRPVHCMKQDLKQATLLLKPLVISSNELINSTLS